MERNFYQRFFELSKKNLPHVSFHSLATFCKGLSGESEGTSTTALKETQADRYFKIINISECWCEIGYTSVGSIINQSWITNFPLLHFSKWFMDNFLCLCDEWKVRSYVNVKFSASSIFSNGSFYLKYYFLRHSNFPSKRFS